MRNILFASFLLALSTGYVNAQFSKLHVKTPSGSTVGITTGTTSNKVLGFNHDGTSGIISTTTLNGASDYSPLKFATAGATRLTIFENGYVGIGGTGTPTAELTVAGKIHTREIKVNITAGDGPDYVFLNTYRLKPLSEVSLFINQHRHLPEVPPASEMERDGVNVGEMNMLLLKKVEELTLYLIEQNNKVESLQAELKKIQDELAAIKSSK